MFHVERWVTSMHLVCIANQKGGVGKTTTAIHLALGAAWTGLRVLLCDLDAQANATSGLGLDRPTAPLPRPQASGRGGLDVLFLGDWLQAVGNASATALRNILPEGAYHLAVLDCPPAFGRATDTALDLADSILVPIQCEYFAMEGLTQILTSIGSAQARRRRHLPLLGILLTLFDPDEPVSREVASEVRRNFPEQTFQTVIERDAAFVEASSFGKTLYEYDIHRPGAWDYMSLTMEVLKDVRRQVGAQIVRSSG